MSRLDGKVAIVTGASKGIGAEIARELARNGASVVVNYASDAEGADRVVSDILKAGGNAIAIQAGVNKASEAQRLIADALKAFGKLDILVNNAGVFRFLPLAQFSEEEFYRQYNTNVLGTLLVTREAAEHFGPNGGSIVNIGSNVAAYTPANSSIYSSSKAAINAITGVLSKELGPKKIRVNSVNPGLIDTEGATAAGVIGGEYQKKRAAETPLGRTGLPTDIAPLVAFLASDGASWLTGEIINVAGGF